MSRKAQIAVLSHLYALYIVLNLQWRLGDLLFNITPFICYGSLIYVWLKTSYIKLNHTEKVCLTFLLTFQAIICVYYEFCSIISRTKGGFEWIKLHNSYMLYFIIFIVIFYIGNYLNERK